MRAFVISWAVLLAACATPASRPAMGKVSDLSRVDGPARFCEHRVPEQVCTIHHPELAARFQAVGDWCPEHGVPESQCFQCHPELTFEAIPPLPDRADVALVVRQGEDLPSLEEHAAAGRVTVFDFYADWCAACREVELHLAKRLNARGDADVAVRKLNVVDWDTPVAKRYLAGVKGLPYVVVYGRDGKKVRSIEGLDLPALDRAIAEGAAR